MKPWKNVRSRDSFGAMPKRGISVARDKIEEFMKTVADIEKNCKARTSRRTGD